MAGSTDTIERETKLQGMGTSRLRKEDARFIRGKGTYIDDIKLPRIPVTTISSISSCAIVGVTTLAPSASATPAATGFLLNVGFCMLEPPACCPVQCRRFRFPSATASLATHFKCG